MADSVPLRLDGYVRVSRVGQRRGERFISPAIQRDQIAAWATGHHAQLLEMFEELDGSGARADRPKLQRAIKRIEDGLSQGLVVSAVDRFGRSLIDELLILERVRDAGGYFVSAMDNQTASTDSGRFVLHILLAKAEFDLGRLHTGWQEAHKRAIARGVFIGPKPPVGYRKTRSGRLRPDPRSAPVITEMFQRRAEGEPISAVARLLERHGVLTCYGNPGWSRPAVIRVLANPAYLGEVHCGPYRRAGAHQPLTDPGTWQRAQQPPHPRCPRTNKPVLLAGMVRCASCSMIMDVNSNVPSSDGGTYQEFACRIHHSGGTCPQPASISSWQLDPYVQDIAMELLRRRRRAPQLRIAAAEDNVEAAEAALARYRDNDRLLTVLGERAFGAGLVARADRVREARLNLADTTAELAIHRLPSVTEMQNRWPAMTRAERHEILRQIIDCVFVAPGYGHPEARVTVCPAGTAPHGLVHRHRRAKLQHLGPRRAWVNPGDPIAQRARWAPARIERELRRVLRDHGGWPRPKTFQEIGQEQLHRQIMLTGGEAVWAHRIGIALDRPPHAAPWTEARIRAALTLYLERRSTFPTPNQMRADGLNGLPQAIWTHGKAERWASEFELEYPGRRGNGSAPYWTEQRIRAQLTAFCADRTKFPTRPDFRRAGRDRLYTAITRHHGVRWWAYELGLSYPRHFGPYGIPTWTDQRIRTELTAFCAGRQLFPRRSQFDRAGRTNLYEAASHHGGVRRWAAQLGLAYDNPGGTTGRPYWTDERIRAELSAFCADRTVFPARPAFHEADRAALYLAVTRHHGVEWWAGQLGLARETHRGGHGRYWTDERIRAALTALCAGRTNFPTRREFRHQHLGGLYSAITQNRGASWWAVQLGIPRSPPTRSRA